MEAEFVATQLRLYLITDDRGRTPEEMARIVAQAIAGGVSAVQLREKSASGETCARILDRLSPLCREAGVALLVNADLLERLPAQAEFDGVHLNARIVPSQCLEPPTKGAMSLRGHLASRLFGRCAAQGCLLGYSAHEIGEAQSLVRCGADFVTFSPIYPTPSKAGILAPRGCAFLREARRAMPSATIVALGGVGLDNAREVIEAGANGVAVMRAIWDAPDPLQAARRLREAVTP